VVGEVAPDGTLTRSQSFDVYGCVRASSGAATTKHKFVGSLGHPSDDETGLIYMRARHYDPVCGRFVSEDPAREGRNWYAYVRNNPTNATDRSGKFIDILFSLLDGGIEDGRDAATSEAVKQWGLDKIRSAVAKEMGRIVGYLLADELDAYGGTNVGIFLKAGNRQVNIDFVSKHFDGYPHIDFQLDTIGGVKYERIFLEGLLEGLEGAGW
jgi:RHS repeat-associated protein